MRTAVEAAVHIMFKIDISNLPPALQAPLISWRKQPNSLSALMYLCEAVQHSTEEMCLYSVWHTTSNI